MDDLQPRRRNTEPIARALRALRDRGESELPPTVGLVLAAGASSRMGRPKALLRLGGRTFVEHICLALRRAGCAEVVVVVGAHADRIGPAVPGFARVVVNSGWSAGMRSSLRVGLRALPPQRVVLTHVDRPWVADETLSALVASPARGVVVPHVGGRPGHPVRLPPDLRPRLLAGDDRRLDAILAEAGRTALTVSDRGVLLNVNTPADHRWLVSSAPRT